MPALLLTDIEGSTRLWEAYPADMSQALARHDIVVAEQVGAHHGILLKDRSEGDSAFAVFPDADAAASCAYSLQQALDREQWPGVVTIKVRMAIHLDTEGRLVAGGSEADRPVGQPSEAAANRAAQLRGAGHGGQILLSAAAARATSRLPKGAWLQDLGRHGLADLSLPERIFSLQGPGLASEHPPLRTLEPLVHNLPAQSTSFIGRHGDLAAVIEMLAAHRLVTVSGGGGWGKTRLALEVASMLVDSYPDGVWLAEVPWTSNEPLAATIASALGFHMGGGRAEGAGEVLSILAEKRTLLVLDGCEGALDAARRLVVELLAAAPGISVLTTTRRPLGLAPEVVHRPGPLGLPEPGRAETVEELRHWEATTLFLDRALGANPYYVPVDPQAASIAALVTKLRGHPLAVELAATRIRVLTPAQILQRLDDPLRILAGGNRSAPPRLQSIRASVESSIRLLDPSHLAVLDYLAATDRVDAVEDAVLEEAMVELEAAGLLDPPNGEGQSRRLDPWVRAYVLQQQPAVASPPNATMAG